MLPLIKKKKTSNENFLGILFDEIAMITKHSLKHLLHGTSQKDPLPKWHETLAFKLFCRFEQNFGFGFYFGFNF